MDAQRAAVAWVAAVGRQFRDGLGRVAAGLGPDGDWPTPVGHIPHPGFTCAEVDCPGDDYRSGDWDELYGDVDDEDANDEGDD